jgi:chromosome segregation ATPase
LTSLLRDISRATSPTVDATGLLSLQQQLNVDLNALCDALPNQVQELQRTQKLLNDREVEIQLLQASTSVPSASHRPSSVDEMNKALEDLQDRLLLREKEISKLQNELNAASKTNSRSVNEISVMKSRIAALQKELNSVSINPIDPTPSISSPQLSELADQRDRALQEALQLRAQLAAAQQEALQLRSESAGAQQETQNLQLSLANAQQLNNVLQQRLSGSEAEVTALKQQVEGLQADVSRLLRSLESRSKYAFTQYSRSWDDRNWKDNAEIARNTNMLFLQALSYISLEYFSMFDLFELSTLVLIALL